LIAALVGGVFPFPASDFSCGSGLVAKPRLIPSALCRFLDVAARTGMFLFWPRKPDREMF